LEIGDAVGIAGQITQHLLGPSEGSLAVDDPLDLAQRSQEPLEGSFVVER